MGVSRIKLEENRRDENIVQFEEKDSIIQVPDEVRLEFKNRTGIYVPNEYHIKRSSKISLKTKIREHIGMSKKKLENNDRHSIFEFDFDPQEYNAGKWHGYNAKETPT